MPNRSALPLRRTDLPVWIGEIEISRPLSDIEIPPHAEEGPEYQRARLLVRLHRVPVGYVSLPLSHLNADAVAEIVWKSLGEKIQEHLRNDGAKVVSGLTANGISSIDSPRCQTAHAQDRPLISVVVCTRDRPEGAAVALRELVKLEYEPFEIVLVDNAPSSDATKEIVKTEFGADMRIRYVREPKPGLSFARNRGVHEAKGEIIAFTDDDVHVDSWWLNGILSGFRRTENVGCVTGLIPSAELENSVQLYFDQRVTWGSSCEPRVFDIGNNKDNSFLYPYSAGIFGTGANFAMRRDVIVALGGFDEALGAGMPCGGGEDLDIFVRTLLAKYTLVYEPSAIIGHIHRAEFDDLRKQMFSYGSGFTAFVFKFLADPRTAPGVLVRIPKGLMRLRKIARKATENQVLPKDIMAREMKGMLLGPYLYWKGRRRLGSINRQFKFSDDSLTGSGTL